MIIKHAILSTDLGRLEASKKTVTEILDKQGEINWDKKDDRYFNFFSSFHQFLIIKRLESLIFCRIFIFELYFFTKRKQKSDFNLKFTPLLLIQSWIFLCLLIRMAAVAIMLPVADLCSMYKPWEVHRKVVLLVMEEMWAQVCLFKYLH